MIEDERLRQGRGDQAPTVGRFRWEGWMQGSMAPALAGLAVLMLLALPAPARADRTVLVDSASQGGIWEGWGCSLAWWANQFGRRDDLADVFFSLKAADLTTDTGSYRLPGLGFNIARYNIGGTSAAPAFGRRAVIPETMPPFRQIQGFWLDGASDDPDSPSFHWSADACQRAMLVKARERGADRFEAFSNAPMWWMCRNDSTAGSDDGKDNLDARHRKIFARYLAIVARRARDEWGIHFGTVEPFNEPSAYWWKFPGTQEGCAVAVAAQEEVIRALRSELDARGLSRVGIAASDENTVDEALKTWNGMTPQTRSLIDCVNVHGYYGQRAYRGPNRAELHKAVSAAARRLWLSEYGERDGSGATMARSIALDVNEMRVTAWVYWQPLDSGGWGLVQSNPGDNWIGPPNPKYYVLAQYSRHIRPGMVLLGTDDTDTVAAYDHAKQRLVLVTLNAGEDTRVAYDLRGFEEAAGPASLWVSSTGEGERYTRLKDVAFDNGILAVGQPGRSVQTVEVDNVRLPDGARRSRAALLEALGVLGRLQVRTAGPARGDTLAGIAGIAREAFGLNGGC
jgi:galactan endo-1,6-beta-galactosidase